MGEREVASIGFFIPAYESLEGFLTYMDDQSLKILIVLCLWS